MTQIQLLLVLGIVLKMVFYYEYLLKMRSYLVSLSNSGFSVFDFQLSYQLHCSTAASFVSSSNFESEKFKLVNYRPTYICTEDF